jgi:CelD/BcsL family acetyltransferase involved in cellulose biosynthesis
VRELAQHRGPLWHEWLALWHTLQRDERDSSTHPAWLVAHLHSLPDDLRDVRLFVCRDAHCLLAIVPFEVAVRQTVFGAASVLVHENEPPLEGASLAVRRGDVSRVLTALVETPIDGGSRPALLLLDKVDATHALLQAPGISHWIEESDTRSVIDVSGGYEAVLNHVGKNFRGNLRKARNKLTALPGARFETLTAVSDMPRALERLADVEARSWKAQQGTDLARDARVREFFRIAIPQLAGEGRVVFHFVAVDGQDIGAQLGLRFDDRLELHKTAYDEGFPELSAGNLLIEHAIRECCPLHGVRQVNLVTGLDWHAKWKPEPLRTYQVRVFPQGPRGLWARAQLVPLRDRTRTCLARSWLLTSARRVRDAVRQVVPSAK